MKLIWKDKEINTMGETMDAAIAAFNSGEAKAFKSAYIDSLLDDHTLAVATKIVEDNLNFGGSYYGVKFPDLWNQQFDCAKKVTE